MTLAARPVDARITFCDTQALGEKGLNGFHLLDAHQFLIESPIKIGELIGVETHEVQDGGMDVFDVVSIVNCRTSEFIRGSNFSATFHPATGHPHGESVAVVISATSFGILGGRLPTEFTAPDDQRVVEHSAFFEVFQKSGNRSICFPRVQIVVVFQVAMRIPVGVVVVATGIDLHKSNTSFLQAAGHQTLSAETRAPRFIDPVKFHRLLGFLSEVDRFRRCGLHFVGEFVICNPCRKVRISRSLIEMLRVVGL